MNEVCRFCGDQISEFIDLFEKKLIEKITSCLQLKFPLDDDLPKKICYTCNEKLENIFDFIDVILCTEKKFKTQQLPKYYSQSLKIVPVANLLAREVLNDCNTLDNVKEKIYKLPNLRIQKINKKPVNSTVVEHLGNSLDKNNTNEPQISNLIQKLQKKSTNLTISKIGKKAFDLKRELDDIKLELDDCKIEDVQYEHDILLDNISDINNIDNVCIDDVIHNVIDEDIDDDDEIDDDDDEDYEEEEEDDDDEEIDDDITENYEPKFKKNRLTTTTTASTPSTVTSSTVVNKKIVNTKQRVMVVKMESPAAYVCMTCKEKFPAFEPLKEHMKNNNKCKMVHLTCDVCSKICESKKALYQHSLTHREKNTYICDECGKTYSNRFNLENHKSSFHGEQVEEYGSIYKCKVCDKQFTNRKELYAHINSHTKEPSIHLCDSCGKCFSSLETLRSHIRIHLDIRPFGCERCDKRFRSRLQLQQHLHVHTGIKPFTCEQCGKTFAKKGSLVSHVRIHSGETPYQCNICFEKFSSSSKVKTHTKTHQ